MIAATPAESDWMETLPRFYTPERLHRLLNAWDELTALAETPQSARNLLTPGETPIEPRTGHVKGAGDPLRWADVVADVESAHRALSSGGYGPLVVAAAMTGCRPSAFAATIHGRKTDILACYRETVKKMAHFLDPSSSSTAPVEMPS